MNAPSPSMLLRERKMPSLSNIRKEEKRAEQERKGQFTSSLAICRKLHAYQLASRKVLPAPKKNEDQTISNVLKIEACGSALRSLAGEIRKQHPQISALQSMEVATALAGNSALSLSSEQMRSLEVASSPFFSSQSRLAQQTQKLVKAALGSTVAAEIAKTELENQLLPSRETIEKQTEALKGQKNGKANALIGELQELTQKKEMLAQQVDELKAEVGQLEAQKQQRLAELGAASQASPLAKLLANHAVLVVEDDVVSQELVVRMLTSMGIGKSQIIATADPREALKKASDLADEGVPMLVLLDYQLPYKLGGQVARELRENKRMRAEIVGMTAFKGIKDVSYNDPGEQEIDVIIKPFDKGDVVRAISRTLAKSKN